MKRFDTPAIIKDAEDYPCEMTVVVENRITYPMFETKEAHEIWLANYKSENGNDPIGILPVIEPAAEITE